MDTRPGQLRSQQRLVSEQADGGERQCRNALRRRHGRQRKPRTQHRGNAAKERQRCSSVETRRKAENDSAVTHSHISARPCRAGWTKVGRSSSLRCIVATSAALSTCTSRDTKEINPVHSTYMPSLQSAPPADLGEEVAAFEHVEGELASGRAFFPA